MTEHVIGFFHAGVTVQNMDRSLVFYRDGLGLEVEFDRYLDAPYLREVLAVDFRRIRAVYLSIPNAATSFVELLEYQGADRLSGASRPCDFGTGHLCLYVDDVAAAYEKLVDRGFDSRSGGIVEITEGPNIGARSTYMEDPDGYAVELFEARDTRMRRQGPLFTA